MLNLQNMVKRAEQLSYISSSFDFVNEHPSLISPLSLGPIRRSGVSKIKQAPTEPYRAFSVIEPFSFLSLYDG